MPPETSVDANIPPSPSSINESIPGNARNNTALLTESNRDKYDLKSVIQVDDKLYAADKLASIHPGGDLFVKVFAGVDATEAFLSYHRRNFPHNKLTEYVVGEATSRKSSTADADYLELCAIIDQVLPRHKSFAPWHYYVKAISLILVTISLEVYMHTTNSYKWYLSIPLGLCFAWMGMNIQHDANHGAISRYPIVNKIFGYTQNWIGGSMVDWIHQHVVQHHVNTNDVHNDPDIVGSALIRLNPMMPLEYHHSWQFMYIFILIAFFGFTVIEYSLEFVLRGIHHIPMSPLIGTYRFIDVCSSLLFLIRWICIPLYNSPSVYTFLNIAPMYIVAGYYLAFFFLISHNFEGVTMFDKTTQDKNESFLYTQTVSSSNVGGSFLCFLNGGLNYQIEHHLFPRIQHSHYPKIARIVRAFCEKKNIPYTHFPTISDNALACVKHLMILGKGTDGIKLTRS